MKSGTAPRRHNLQLSRCILAGKAMRHRIGNLFPLMIALAGMLQAQSKLAPIKFSDTRLDNGLRVIITEDHHAPVYALVVSYAVGSKDERQGRTGFAHLF